MWETHTTLDEKENIRSKRFEVVGPVEAAHGGMRHPSVRKRVGLTHWLGRACGSHTTPSDFLLLPLGRSIAREAFGGDGWQPLSLGKHKIGTPPRYGLKNEKKKLIETKILMDSYWTNQRGGGMKEPRFQAPLKLRVLEGEIVGVRFNWS